MGKKPITSDFPKFENNPFHEGTLESLNIRSFPIRPKGPIVNADTGEVLTKNVYLHKQTGFADNLNAVKVFNDSCEMLSNLSVPGIKVLFYVMVNLQKGSDKVYIGPLSVKKFTGYSANKDVYKGIAELIEKGVIAKSTEVLIYFINPNILFSGNKGELIKKLPKGN
jgi:hypothetical protein